ncbi:uncharacterized protein LOC132301549 [Cornus florida]|uniref:uncharacterized protein LOC132301549 n=1 Tax=Cornus florida TaxID=4283 RepID=UPI00289AABA6|nr:uncharacterized protein LOC132301549 [Cornus florida]
MRVIAESHLGICGAHQAGIKMRWLLRKYGYYWKGILKDCIEFAKTCTECLEHGPVQRVPAINMQPVVKIWLFRGWALDFIGKLTPPSIDGHTHIVVATDYFYKVGKGYSIKDLSTPYFAQSNGQAEASNKVILNILKKMIENHPREWHHLLFEALWAYRNSKRSSTGITPYMLTYGHDAVLPMKMTIRSAREAFQNKLTPADYNHAMLVEFQDLNEVCLNALDHIIGQKNKVMRAYNKKVKAKTFVEGDLVWQVRFPPGVKDKEYGKWTPNWKGPYLVERVLGKGAYRLMDIDGESHKHPMNGVYLKEYHPSIYESWTSTIIQPAT